MLKSIIWLVTGKCNYNCAHCYASWFKELKELETEECLRIIDEAGEIGVLHIGFSGGEPLLRKDLFQLIERAREYDINVTLVTNGSLIDEKSAKRLSKEEVSIYVSVDGLREVHEALRGRGSWNCLKKAIGFMRKEDVEFAVVTTLNKHNLRGVKKILEFSLKCGAESHCFIPLLPFGKASWSNVLSKNEVKYVLDQIKEAIEAIDHRINLWCMPFAKRFFNSSKIHVGSCRKANVMDIGVNGDILLCDVLNIPLTNIKGKDLAEAWVEQENHHISRIISNPDLVEPCSSCKVKDVCLGGCYARSFSLYGEFNKPDPLCPFTK